ncbi:hypothetical protein P20311_3414 [Pseudoalteromonas sp. BSi20311]|nr:hypothetical protein P20311_3414 [Pseudoalteromonas sp. BSi20311]
MCLHLKAIFYYFSLMRSLKGEMTKNYLYFRHKKTTRRSFFS